MGHPLAISTPAPGRSARAALRTLAALGLLAAALIVIATWRAAPASAAVRLQVGIGDQSMRMLDDPRFKALRVARTRVVVPFDVMRRADQLARYGPLLDTAVARRVQPLVAFGHDAVRAGHLPLTREYRAAMVAFRRRFPRVTVISPWNEANHASQPTARHPERAAAYYRTWRSLCPRCTIVAADVLDQSGVDRWIAAFRRAARTTPRLWGLHNYRDVNHFTDRSTHAFLRLVPGKVWLTETGGVVRFASSLPYDERRAARATRHVFWLAHRYASRIARVYLYEWSGSPLGQRWDSGLIAANGRARLALNVVERQLHRPLTRIPPIPRIARFPAASSR